MKKLFVGFGIIIAIFVGLIVVVATIDFNRLGKENMYVQVPEEARLEETKLDSGEIMKRYWYILTAYNEDGEATEVEFSAAKQLRADAYLMLYVKNGNEVSSYDEVQKEDIPAKIIEKF